MILSPIDRPGLDDDDRGAGLGARLGRDMGEVLGLVVVAEETVAEIAAVGLVDDPAVGIAEDVDRRDRDDPGDRQGAACSGTV